MAQVPLAGKLKSLLWRLQQGSSTKNLFLTGSKNYKFSTISDHEKSKTHIEAVEVQKSREKAVAKKTTAHKCLGV